MRTLGTDSIFTKIPFDETVDIWTKTLFKNTERVQYLSKTEYETFL